MGKVVVVDEDEAAAHVAPHDQFLSVQGRELRVELEKERVVVLDVAAGVVL